MKSKLKMHTKLNKLSLKMIYTQKANKHINRHPTLVARMEIKTSIIWHFTSLRIDNNCWQEVKTLQSSHIADKHVK